MANTDNPSGFRPVKNIDGSPYNGATIKCALLAANATATFVGDLVKLSGSASAEGYPSVQQGAASDTAFFGVITSFDPDPTNLALLHRTASTLRTCNVAPAASAIFAVQVDESVAITDVGNTADVVVGSGNTTTGRSGMELDSSDIGTGGNLLILGLVQSPDNEFGTNAKVLVRINESALNKVATGV